jgi:hypothetical protein
MKVWEFLIQQEGNRSWLPLESPNVEIVEGRYRVVARSSRVNTATEIRVAHYATTEVPPVRRVRKRSTQTNPEGLVVVLPFTQLQPGLWELYCTSDLMAEMMGESWQHVVQLHVMSLTAAEVPRIDPDWQMTAAESITETTADSDQQLGSTELVPLQTPPEPIKAVPDIATELLAEAGSVQPVTAALAANQPAAEVADSGAAHPEPQMLDLAETLQRVEQSSQQLVDSIFENLSDFTGRAIASGAAEGQDEASSPYLQVVLERETFVIQRGESLNLTGRIEFTTEQQTEQPTPQIAMSELRVQLHDPQTSQLLMNEVHPIGDRVPPFQFSGTISLPEHYQTYLVLGKLVFQGMATGTEPVVVTRSFNVTTDLHELIESVANDFPDADSLPEAAAEIAEPLPQFELSRLKEFQRSAQQPLPPQLRPTAASGRTHATLDLPSFKLPASLDQDPAAQHELPSDAEISYSAADLLPQVQESGSAHPSDAAPEILVANRGTEPPFDWNEMDSRLPLWGRKQAAHLSNAPEDVSFRALNWQNRFLERLQALATDPEVSTSLGLLEAEAGMALMPVPESVPERIPERHTVEANPPLPSLDADLAAAEIVVDDEALAIPTADDAASEPEGDWSGPVLPANEPIPIPRLQLPTHELVAGQEIMITIKLPSLLARVYVKLWLRDRQTRELLGTPRWIIDFVPDGFGNQMAKTEVIVPPGYLKVQFEAIAVEIATQRESDKVTLTRPITPPDLSPLSLDRLEI